MLAMSVGMSAADTDDVTKAPAGGLAADSSSLALNDAQPV